LRKKAIVSIFDASRGPELMLGVVRVNDCSTISSYCS